MSLQNYEELSHREFVRELNALESMTDELNTQLTKEIEVNNNLRKTLEENEKLYHNHKKVLFDRIEELEKELKNQKGGK